MVHRRVGVLHQLAQFATVLRAECDTDTGCDEKLAAFQHEGFHQAGENLLGHMNRPIQGRLLGGAGLQQQREFVAAHARNGVVFVNACKQAQSHFLQHAVTGGMAQ